MKGQNSKFDEPKTSRDKTGKSPRNGQRRFTLKVTNKLRNDSKNQK